MAWSLLIFPVLVPFLFWAAYHYYHDRHRPEPIVNLIVCVLLGVAAAYLSRAMYAGLGLLELRFDAQMLAADNLPGLFAYAVLGIGFTEELAKLLPFVLIVLRFKAFDEPLDGIVYGSFLALGFSLVENLHFAQFLTPTEIAARGFAGPLVHIVFTSVWAYHIGIAHMRGEGGTAGERRLAGGLRPATRDLRLHRARLPEPGAGRRGARDRVGLDLASGRHPAPGTA